MSDKENGMLDAFIEAEQKDGHFTIWGVSIQGDGVSVRQKRGG